MGQTNEKRGKGESNFGKLEIYRSSVCAFRFVRKKLIFCFCFFDRRAYERAEKPIQRKMGKTRTRKLIDSTQYFKVVARSNKPRPREVCLAKCIHTPIALFVAK